MGFIDWLLGVDTDIFKYLNSIHSTVADSFWWSVTDKYSWIPFMLVIVTVIIQNKGRESILIVLLLALTVLLCDQLSGFLKDWVMRLRPSRDPSLMYDIHIVNGYRGGLYSFVSSHAANTFGVALFLSLLVRNWIFSAIIFLYAGLNAYSRIYLGVHFPLDIIVGGMLGMLIAWGTFSLHKLIILRVPALSSIITDRSGLIHTKGGFKKSHVATVAMVFMISIFYFLFLATLLKDFMP